MFQLNPNIVHLPSVDSTNNYVARGIKSGALELGSVVMADFQESGRGQRGAEWESQLGENLLISFLFPGFSLTPENGFLISKWFAVVVVQYMKAYWGITAQVKWPNDILVEDEKLAGILVESALKGKYYHQHLVGLGLNVRQIFASGSGRASLCMHSHRNDSPLTVAEELVSFLNTKIVWLQLQKYAMFETEYQHVLWNKIQTRVWDVAAQVWRDIEKQEVQLDGRMKLVEKGTGVVRLYGLKELKW